MLRGLQFRVFKHPTLVWWVLQATEFRPESVIYRALPSWLKLWVGDSIDELPDHTGSHYMFRNPIDYTSTRVIVFPTMLRLSRANPLRKPRKYARALCL